jgi:hypothetical protein
MLADEETEVFMPDFASALGASKSASALLVLFIPSKDRRNKSIDQRYWVKETLNVLGTLFGGATAFPRGEGIWRDDVQGGRLLFDNPVVIQCYTSEHLIEEKMPCCGPFSTGWDVKRGREQSDWLSTTITLRSDFRWKRPRRRSNRKLRKGGK